VNTIHIRLDLESDVVVSRSSATFGGHESLDYLPGAMLRGAFAAYLNREAPALIDAALFSGRLRFGPAYPIGDKDSPSVPVPRSWHHGKGNSLETTRDLSSNKAVEGEQFVQLRDGYLASAKLVSVEMAFTMRTATDRGGRASDGLLFGYQAIRAGQGFMARIDVDDPTLVGHVEKWIASGKVRLGRSRTAEFGTVRLAKTSAGDLDALRSEGPKDGTLIGYCFSDLLLRDAGSGAPTLTPMPAHFGLTGGEFDPKRSYLRTRAYSPFNGERRRPDLERQVIEAGSVIVFTNVPASEVTAVVSRAGAAHGEAIEDGLGQVLWNPKLLTPPAGLAKAERQKGGPKASVNATSAPDGSLGTFVNGFVLAAQRDAEIDKTVTRLGNMLREFRIPPSQWGVLRDIGRGGGTFEAVRGALSEQISKSKGVSAQLIWTRRIGTTSAAKVLEEGLDGLPDKLRGDVGVLLERLAARMMRENRGVDRV
jgi:CRISPR-associated protein Csx10